MHPEVGNLCRFPHVALFTFPGTGILDRVRSKTPTLAQLVRLFLPHEVGHPAVHGIVAGGIDDHIGIEMCSVVQDHSGFVQCDHLPALELDLAVDDQLAGTDVDVIAGPAAQVFHEETRLVIAPIQPEARFFETLVELCIAFLHLGIGRDLEFVQDRIRQRGKDQVRLFGRDTIGNRFLRVQRTQPHLHQRIRPHDMSGRALHHGDIHVVFPKCSTDVMGRIVRADDHRLLALVGIRSGMSGRMVLVPLERVHAGILGHPGLAGHACGHHQLLGFQDNLFAIAVNDDGPFAFGFIKAGGLGSGAGPVIQLHHLGVHLEPIADLVLGAEDGPVLGELDVGQMIVPDRVMQAERLVAVTPAVSGTVVLFHDDGRHTQLPKARAQRDATLPTADDQAIGLGRVTQFRFFFLALFEPRRPVLARAVLGSKRSGKSFRLFMALEFDHRGQQGPDLAILQPDQPVAAGDFGLEFDPGGGHAPVFGRKFALGDCPS